MQPNAVILGYPVVTAGKYAHEDSFTNLAGEDAELKSVLSLELQVKDGLPPFFIWHTVEDAIVPVQNSLLLAGALTEHGVPYELHLFQKGFHGMSVCTQETNTNDSHNANWIPLCMDWLADTFDFKM